MDILNVSGVSKCYGKGKASVQALKNISFTVEKGKFIGIMGASGSGKSTLLNLISTIDYATEGNIIINDTNITKLNIKGVRLLENIDCSHNRHRYWKFV